MFLFGRRKKWAWLMLGTVATFNRLSRNVSTERRTSLLRDVTILRLVLGAKFAPSGATCVCVCVCVHVCVCVRGVFVRVCVRGESIRTRI